jgi:SH3 domain protein
MDKLVTFLGRIILLVMLAVPVTAQEDDAVQAPREENALPTAQGEIPRQTVYVSDILYVSLRDGKTEDAETIRVVKSDTALQILEEDEFLIRVETPEGDEGWLKKKYTTITVPKSIALKKMAEEVNQLKVTGAELQAANDQLRAALNQTGEKGVGANTPLEKDLQKSRLEAARFKKALDQEQEKCARLLKGANENGGLENRIKELTREKETLRKEIDTVRRERGSVSNGAGGEDRHFMIWLLAAGAGIWLLGLILGKMSRKKEYY